MKNLLGIARCRRARGLVGALVCSLLLAAVGCGGDEAPPADPKKSGNWDELVWDDGEWS